MSIIDNFPTDLLNEYKRAFQILDKKKSGKISLRDLNTVTCSIGIHLSEKELNVVARNVIGLKGDFDFVTQCIEFPSFLCAMAAIITDCVPDNEIIQIFAEFDKDGDGVISPHELRNLLSRLGDDFTEKDIQEMIAEADSDGDGVISLHEFIQIMTLSAMETFASQPSFTNISKSLEHYTSDPDKIESDECSQVQDDAYLVPEIASAGRRRSSFSKRRKSLVKWFRGRSKLSTMAEETTNIPEPIKRISSLKENRRNSFDRLMFAGREVFKGASLKK